MDEQELLQRNYARDEYVSLTDTARSLTDGRSPSYIVQSWLRSRSTLEYLKAWEEYNNPGFDVEGYNRLRDDMKDSNFTITPKKWIEYTNAIGIATKPGKNGGSLARREIQFEFAMWLHPRLKYFVISNFFMSKDIEQLMQRENE